MTSLEETLPILDEAVPALPGKVEAVARESQALEQAAREALADFEHKRADAKALFEQVRHALDAIEEQAGQEQQGVAQMSQALQAGAEEPRHGAESGEQELRAGAQAATTAFGALATHLTREGDRTRAAHDEARQSLDAMDGRAQSSRSELDGLVDEMTAHVESARQAVVEEQAKVAEGMDVLRAAMTRLLGEARARLAQTRSRLDELRADQEAAVSVALSDLTEGRGRLEQELAARLQSDVQQSVTRELEGVAAALTEMGQEVVRLQSDCQGRREHVEPQFDAVKDLLSPLQRGVEQVRQAADQIGISWP